MSDQTGAQHDTDRTEADDTRFVEAATRRAYLEALAVDEVRRREIENIRRRYEEEKAEAAFAARVSRILKRSRSGPVLVEFARMFRESPVLSREVVALAVAAVGKQPTRRFWRSRPRSSVEDIPVQPAARNTFPCVVDENVDAARKMLRGTRSMLWGTSSKALDRAAAELKAALLPSEFESATESSSTP